MCGIYKVTNKTNGKCYIGQSTNIEFRWSQHRTRPFQKSSENYNCKFYRAIRKYGLENFDFEVVEECPSNQLGDREKFYIALYGSFGDNGYNMNEGGIGPHNYQIPENVIDQIINKLKTSLDSAKDIANELGVSPRTVASINSGDYRRRDFEVYPIRQNLSKISQIAKTDNGLRPKREPRQEKNRRCVVCGKVITPGKQYCSDCSHIMHRKVERPEPLELAKLICELGFEEVGRRFGVSDKSVSKWCIAYKMPNTKKSLKKWYDDQIGVVDAPKEKKLYPKPVKQIDPKTGEVIAIFPNERAAAHAIGARDGNHIGEVCRGIHKTAHGYIWEFA